MPRTTTKSFVLCSDNSFKSSLVEKLLTKIYPQAQITLCQSPTEFVQTVRGQNPDAVLIIESEVISSTLWAAQLPHGLTANLPIICFYSNSQSAISSFAVFSGLEQTLSPFTLNNFKFALKTLFEQAVALAR